jgi:hypothetical protein
VTRPRLFHENKYSESNCRRLQFFCDLFDEVDTLHHDNLPRIFKKKDGPVRELDYFLGLISDKSGGLFVAELDGEIVGFVHAIVKDAPGVPVFVSRRYATIDSIIVKTRFHTLFLRKQTAFLLFSASRGGF